MTEQLSNKDKKIMKEVFNETPEEAIRRQEFWRKQSEPEFKSLKSHGQVNSTDTKCCCPKDLHGIGWCAWCPVHGLK